MNINQFLGSIPQTKITNTFGIVGQDEQDISNRNTGSSFADIFKKAFDNVIETQNTVDKDNYNMAMGNFDNLHQAMINTEKASTALELTTQITSRAVNAYNEIMRMQI